LATKDTSSVSANYLKLTPKILKKAKQDINKMQLETADFAPWGAT